MSAALYNKSIPCLWCDESSHNFLSLKEYFDYKFTQHSRLLVVRLDLKFQSGSFGQNDAWHAKDCFQRFLNNIRVLKITENLVGYAWAMEYGPNTGFHYHCFFLFDGARSQQDIKLGRELGWYWVETITQGTGLFYCSNDDKGIFEANNTLGIGMIHRDDQIKRAHLLGIASYIVKDNGLPSAVLPEGCTNFRTFGKGTSRI